MRHLKTLLFVVLLVFVLIVSVMLTAAQEDETVQPAQPTETPIPAPAFDLPITSNLSYIVQAGDTLDTIGALFDVSVPCIREVNELSRTDLLIPDDTLLISIECPVYNGGAFVEFPRQNAPGLTGADGTYAVRPNDTLDTIAQSLDVSVQALADENDITDSRRLFVGTILTIPEGAPPYGVLPARDADDPELAALQSEFPDSDTYIVQPGDTLDEIALSLNISLVSLERANGIEFGQDLLAGQTLIIPADAPPYGTVPALDADDTAVEERREANPGAEEYIVQPNDTLDTIGQELNVSVVALQQTNDLGYGRDLLAGQTLIIPPDAPAYGVFPALATDENLDTLDQIEAGTLAGDTYVIQPGDTLDGVASSLDVSVVAIRTANNIDFASEVIPGRVIVIPADAPAYGAFPDIEEPAGNVVASGEVYVIQPGETIDGIGARFDRDTRCIIEANEITSVRAILPGQTIGIPSNCPPYMGFDVVPGRTSAPPATGATTGTDSTEDTDDAGAGADEAGDEDSEDTGDETEG